MGGTVIQEREEIFDSTKITRKDIHENIRSTLDL